MSLRTGCLLAKFMLRLDDYFYDSREVSCYGMTPQSWPRRHEAMPWLRLRVMSNRQDDAGNDDTQPNFMTNTIAHLSARKMPGIVAAKHFRPIVYGTRDAAEISRLLRLCV